MENTFLANKQIHPNDKKEGTEKIRRQPKTLVKELMRDQRPQISQQIGRLYVRGRQQDRSPAERPYPDLPSR